MFALSRTTLIAGCVTAAVSGCSVITPPPVLPPHEVAQPSPEGTTTVSLVGGLGGGIWTDGGYGLELRVAHAPIVSLARLCHHDAAATRPGQVLGNPRRVGSVESPS